MILASVNWSNSESTNKSIVFGFYPTEDMNMNNVEYNSGIYDDSQHQFSVSVTYNISCIDFNNALKKALELTDNKYNALTFNCTDFAVDVTNSAGLAIPKTKSPIIFNGKYYGDASNAGDLGEDIRELSSGVIDSNGGESSSTICN